MDDGNSVQETQNADIPGQYGHHTGIGKWTIEVGGPDKSFDQIAGIPNSFVFADSMEFPVGKKLPLWLAGFTY